ncbi:hypothetical protein BDC45DRAFT_513987 [Circinella umbellata]|nr:hypothetical protein BDC45DRAFT_513987 [Circinella umbellata]
MGLLSFTKYFSHKSSSDDFSFSRSSSRSFKTPSSRSGSLITKDDVVLGSSSKYLSDPMRTSDNPDYVGGFYDPVSISRHYLHSTDCTNTGA